MSVVTEAGQGIGGRQALGLLGLLMVAILLFIKDPVRGAMDDLPAHYAHHPPGAPLREVIRAFTTAPGLGLTMLGAFLVNIAVGTTWLDPIWLYRERGFSRAGAPIFLGVALIIGGSTGNVLAGWLGGAVMRRV